MSIPAVEQVISAMHVLRNKDGSNRGPEKIRQLHENANYFRQKLQSIGCSVLGSNDSPVMVSISSPLVIHLGKYAGSRHVLQVASTQGVHDYLLAFCSGQKDAVCNSFAFVVSSASFAQTQECFLLYQSAVSFKPHH